MPMRPSLNMAPRLPLPQKLIAQGVYFCYATFRKNERARPEVGDSGNNSSKQLKPTCKRQSASSPSKELRFNRLQQGCAVSERELLCA